MSALQPFSRITACTRRRLINWGRAVLQKQDTPLDAALMVAHAV